MERRLVRTGRELNELLATQKYLLSGMTYTPHCFPPSASVPTRNLTRFRHTVEILHVEDSGVRFGRTPSKFDTPKHTLYQTSVFGSSKGAPGVLSNMKIRIPTTNQLESGSQSRKIFWSLDIRRIPKNAERIPLFSTTLC